MRDLSNAHVRAVLAAGLAWLYDVEQPPNALIQHHAVPGPVIGTRWYGFCPVGADQLPVISVRVAAPQWEPGRWELLNPIGGDAEMKLTRALVESLGYPTRQWWNGAGESGSIGLQRPAHHTLRAAVRRYGAGCPTHPAHGVFCPCGWFKAGNDLLVDPAWPTSPDSDEAHCRICWCTEDAACRGGCAWAAPEEQLAAGFDPMTGDLCTACVPAPLKPARPALAGTETRPIPTGKSPAMTNDASQPAHESPEEERLAAAERLDAGGIVDGHHAVLLAQGLIEIAETAGMPDTYQATDNRMILARAVLAASRARTPLDESAERVLDLCRQAQQNHDGHPSPTWSTWQQLAVALVLNDEAGLRSRGYSVQEATRSVVEGMLRPPADFDAWLATIRAALAAGSPTS